ncbi:MAG: GxxExxY protein [Balneola sp.]|nr:MAG: GxxExxY protein [Balneola sp.]
MIKEEYRFSKETGIIIGCAMRVHSALGNGFPEVIYQRALADEMNKYDLSFGREVDFPVYYDGNQVGSRRADFVVLDKILIELKAIKELEQRHFSQILNYLKAYKLEVGLLINFGESKLTWKRVINSKLPAQIN